MPGWWAQGGGGAAAFSFDVHRASAGESPEYSEQCHRADQTRLTALRVGTEGSRSGYSRGLFRTGSRSTARARETVSRVMRSVGRLVVGLTAMGDHRRGESAWLLQTL